MGEKNITFTICPHLMTSGCTYSKQMLRSVCCGTARGVSGNKPMMLCGYKRAIACPRARALNIDSLYVHHSLHTASKVPYWHDNIAYLG